MTAPTALGRPSRTRRVSRRTRHRFGLVCAYTALICWSIFSVFPIAWTYISSIKPPQEVFAIPPKWVFTPTLHNYAIVLGWADQLEGGPRSRLPEYFVNTVVVCLGSTVLAIGVGTPAAYALARARIRGRRILLTGVLLSRLVPPIVLVVPLYVIWRNVGLLGTRIGLILAFFVFALPFVLWMMRGFFLAVPPALEEAALIDGCSRWGALVRVVVPLAAPGLASTAILVVLSAWTEFLVASLLGGDHAKLLTPAIFGYVSDRAVLWGQVYAASSLVLLPVFIFSLLVQKHIATGLAGGAMKT